MEHLDAGVPHLSPDFRACDLRCTDARSHGQHWSVRRYGTAGHRKSSANPVAHINGTDIRFTRPSMSEELLHTNVYRIAQDDQGFIWFATAYGLYRYDGYSFKVFAPDPQSPNSLSSVEINTVFKDRDGAIWVGCAQFLNKLDPATESFTRYPVPAVNEISQDSAGILWLATPTEGLFGLDPATGSRISRSFGSNPVSGHG